MPTTGEAPDLKQAIDYRIDLFKERSNTSIPCTIVSYDNKKQTVKVRPVMYEMDEDGVNRKQADIAGVPVVFPSSGGGSLTFPIRVGDECLVIFSQRSFDAWWVTGKVPSQSSTQRYHDYNDAIAIVGLKSNKNSLQASTENVELRFDDTSGSMLSKLSMKPDGEITLENKSGAKITLSNGTFRFENNQEELIGVLSELITVMSESLVTTIYGTSPLLSKPLLLQMKARLDTLKG